MFETKHERRLAHSSTLGGRGRWRLLLSRLSFSSLSSVRHIGVVLVQRGVVLFEKHFEWIFSGI